MEKNTKSAIPGDSGAAILDFGTQGYGRPNIEKPMSNDGQNLRENNIPNKVTPYTNVSSSDPVNDDTIDHMSSLKMDRTTGYKMAANYGTDKDTSENAGGE